MNRKFKSPWKWCLAAVTVLPLAVVVALAVLALYTTVMLHALWILMIDSDDDMEFTDGIYRWFEWLRLKIEKLWKFLTR